MDRMVWVLTNIKNKMFDLTTAILNLIESSTEGQRLFGKCNSQIK